MPGLGITIVGMGRMSVDSSLSDVKFYAILSVGAQYRLVSLTPALSCIGSASEGRDREVLTELLHSPPIPYFQRHVPARVLRHKFKGHYYVSKLRRGTTQMSTIFWRLTLCEYYQWKSWSYRVG